MELRQLRRQLNAHIEIILAIFRWYATLTNSFDCY